MSRLALIAVQADSHVNFRMPLIEAIVDKGVTVFALASDYDDATREQILAAGATPIDITLARTGMNPLNDFFDALALRRILKSLDIDIVFSSFAKPVIYGSLAAFFAGVKRRYAMIEGLGFVFTDNGAKPRLRTMGLRFVVSCLYRIALKTVHKVIFLNDDDLSVFIKRGITEVRRSVVLGGIGVDLHKWSPITPSTNPLRFVFVGRLLREKGICEFIGAARIVRNVCPSCEFVVLGDLDINPGAIQRRQIDEWVTEGVVKWPGRVDVKRWLKDCSVFVLPSYREGVPMSTQEAMAVGLPVITTDAPGCRATIENGVNGFMVPVRDEISLADAMIRFVEEPSLTVSMGYESRRLAEHRFDVRDANTRLTEILEL
jgi:glycosyltransferase involved in cell wall biosynthesis